VTDVSEVYVLVIYCSCFNVGIWNINIIWRQKCCVWSRWKQAWPVRSHFGGKSCASHSEL